MMSMTKGNKQAAQINSPTTSSKERPDHLLIVKTVYLLVALYYEGESTQCHLRATGLYNLLEMEISLLPEIKIISWVRLSRSRVYFVLQQLLSLWPLPRISFTYVHVLGYELIEKCLSAMSSPSTLIHQNS